MGLNIKNEHVHDLVREVARRTGRSQTSAVELALERLLAELAREEDAGRQELDGLLADMRDRVRRTGGRLTTDELYDEAGLPR